MKIGQAGLELIKRFEGFEPDVYVCPAGLRTIGYGHVIRPHESFDTLTEKQAEELLQRDCEIAEKAVNWHCHAKLNQNQFDALVCFVFNLGGAAFKKSTLLKHLNNLKYLEAADQFLRWDKAAGKVLPGLTSRRRAERALFLKDLTKEA